MDTTDNTRLIGSNMVYRYTIGKLDAEKQVFENPNQAFLCLYMKDIHPDMGAEDFVRRGNVYFICATKPEQVRETYPHPLYGVKATQRAKKEGEQTVITVEYKPMTPDELITAGYVNLPAKFIKRIDAIINDIKANDPNGECLPDWLEALKYAAETHNAGYSSNLASKREQLLAQILEKINVNDDMDVKTLEEAYYIRLTPLGISLVAKSEEQVPKKIAVKKGEVIVA